MGGTEREINKCVWYWANWLSTRFGGWEEDWEGESIGAEKYIGMLSSNSQNILDSTDTSKTKFYRLIGEGYKAISVYYISKVTSKVFWKK